MMSQIVRLAQAPQMEKSVPRRVERSGEDDAHARSSREPGTSQKTSRATAIQTALADMAQRLADLTTHITSLNEAHGAVKARLEQCATEQRVLSEMHDECRALRERHHERELLYPMFRALIGIADRCRGELHKLRQLDEACGRDLSIDVAIRYMVVSRKADLVETEAVLARFGVESYQHHDSLFDPRLQKCVKRIASPHRTKHGRLAGRLLPGYRRGEATIRPECVSVCW